MLRECWFFVPKICIFFNKSICLKYFFEFVGAVYALYGEGKVIKLLIP